MSFALLRPAIVPLLLVLVFFLIRFPGADLPLHQDEYKWPRIADPMGNIGLDIPHPPLSQFIYREAGAVVGYDVDLRYVPLLFGLLNLGLLYVLVRRLFDERTAAIAAALFALSYYSILASLMVDTDGQIMPFFFLLSVLAYLWAKSALSARERTLAAVALVSAVTVGLFIKVSFALVPAAIIADFLWERRRLISPRDLVRYAGYGAGFVVLFAALLFLTQYLFTFFDLAASARYWLHFLQLDRGWFQTLIQLAKAALYLSPLLVLVPLYLDRDTLPKVRPFLFYIGFGLIFYVLLFDFSIGALDRYLQYLIVPLTVVTAAVLARAFQTVRVGRAVWLAAAAGVAAAATIFFLQFVPHFVPPLHPKAEWIGRILSLHWNFLYPFSGGSGPLTFYVSFLVLALTWLLSIAAIAVGFCKPALRQAALAFVLPLALVYSAVFAEEYLVGAVNGSAATLVAEATAYIAANDDVRRVVVYNDNGGDEILRTGKYEKRLYTSPQFDVGQKVETMNAYSGHYLVIDAPPIDPESVYAKYFATCVRAFERRLGYMSAVLYDCRLAPDIVLE